MTDAAELTDDLGLLALLAGAVEDDIEAQTADPIGSMLWFPLQWAFLRDPATVKQIRCGNQAIGKSTCALAEVVARCLGRPIVPDGPVFRPPPIEAWVICATWQQSVAIQGKLHALIPADTLHPDTEFDPIKGYRGRNPAARFKNGSIVKIKTTNQGGLALAGATIDVALFDEPPSDMRTYVEVSRRLAHRGGTLLLAYTPVNAPVDYLRDLVAAGQIEDHWAPMDPEQLVQVDRTGRSVGVPFRGPDGRERDAQWISEQRAKVPDHEQPVVIDGEWEMRSLDRFFVPFRNGGSRSHVHTRLPDADVDLVLGLDHGHRPGKQVAALMLVWRTWVNVAEQGRPTKAERRVHVYVLDEYCDHTGEATVSDDAAGICAMLARNGYTWDDLSHAFGDRVHAPGTGDQKSNRDLTAAIAKRLGRRLDRNSPGRGDPLWPHIKTAKRGQGRGKGSLETRSRWLYHRMTEPDGFGVHPRCKRIIEALNRYDLMDDDYKDPIDAMVYGLDPYIYGSGPTGNVPTVRVR